MNPWIYFTLVALAAAGLSSFSFFIKLPQLKTPEDAELDFGAELNEIAFRSLIAYSIILFSVSALVLVVMPTGTMKDPMVRIQKLIPLFLFTAPLTLAIPAMRKYSRCFAFFFCALFQIYLVFSLIVLNLPTSILLALMLTTVFIGIFCPAKSYVLSPFCFLLWAADAVMFHLFCGDILNEPIRPLLTDLGITFFVGGILGVLIYHIRLREYAARKALAQEMKKSDGLLRNILPDDIARELKEHGRAKPRRCENATVLFADIVGFTSIAENVDPSLIVGWLDQIFSMFDTIAERHGLEKLKTIGDCYMTVCGIPEPVDDHAVRTVRAAFEMLGVVKTFKPFEDWDSKTPFFMMRIGIHSGVVIAGIIGRKKFSYDVWGDSVNFAARLEGAGSPGRVNVSLATANQIKDHFKCEPRGLVEVRNRGPIEMFWVENPRKKDGAGK